MPIQIQCPNVKCQQTVTVQEAIAGRSVRCRKCGTAFRATPTLDGQSNDTGVSTIGCDNGLFTSFPIEYGRYRILQLLGKGGMGAVYLAMDSQLNRKVALKIPFFNAKEEPKRAERFIREARSAASLHHPNICTVFDAGDVNGRPFITMAYIVGTPLEDLFEEDRLLPVHSAVEIIRKMAVALQKAHDQSIVHRDLKPANVMITPDGEPVIMDFGLAKLVGETDAKEARLTKDGAILGTPRYMAPEQVNGDQNAIAPATDVYALGVMLFELLTGRAPYSGSLLSVLSQIASAPVPNAKDLRSDIDEQLNTICRKAMAKAAIDRFATMDDLEAALSLWASVSSGSISNESRIRSVEFPGTVDGRMTTISGAMRSKTSGRKLGSHTLDGRNGRSLTSGTNEMSHASSVIAEAQSIRSPQSRVLAPIRFLLADSGRIVTLLSAIAGVIILALIAAIALGHWKRDSSLEKDAVVAVSRSETKDATTNPAKINNTTLVAVPPLRPSLSASDATPSKVLEFQRPEFGEWSKSVRMMPAHRQVEEVTRKLKELNPGFNGVLEPIFVGDAVTELTFITDAVTDISPVRALEKLSTLRCSGSSHFSGTLQDLAPLSGLKLQALSCYGTMVSDLTPLMGMPLASLHCQNTSVSDLSPLEGLPLRVLFCGWTRISSLSPLQGMNLSSLDCGTTNVSDLSPLVNMPISHLEFGQTKVQDISPLKEMPLQFLYFGGSPVSDLSPLAGMPLLSLDFARTKIEDISALKGMPLQYLNFVGSPVSDLSPLEGMPLRELRLTSRGCFKT
ncbi:MAG: protein kinase [Planctomycetaceae bacterium]